MLTSLTEEQKEKMGVYRDAAVASALNTTEADWEVAEASVREMLAAVGVTGVEVLRAVSPVEAAREGHTKAHALDGVGGKTLFQSSYYGSSCARNDFFCEVTSVQLTPEKEAHRVSLSRFVAACGGAYLHSKFVVLYDRPSLLKIRNEGGSGVLHSEDGPAIAWGRGHDGEWSPDAHGSMALYYWGGTKVPEKWIMNKPSTEAEMKARSAEVLAHPNQEQMRAGCEILGWMPVLKSLGMRVIDEDVNPMFGKLVSVNLPSAPDARFLVAMCGTGRTVAVPASEDATTALEAGAMSYGVPVEVYRTLKVRT